MPPVRAEILCNSPPLARATSAAIFITRSLVEAAGTHLLIVKNISDGVALSTLAVAFRHRYMGNKDSGIIVIGASASLWNSFSVLELAYIVVVDVENYQQGSAIRG